MRVLGLCGLLRMSRFWSESMSRLADARQLGFLGKLICGMDTRVDTQPFRVWVRVSNAESR